MRFTDKLFLFSPLFLFASACSAYLDPGSGNALVALLVSLSGATAFFFKTVFYKLKKSLGGVSSECHDITTISGIAIFSEGKNYWFTYKPIIEELIRRGVQFDYYTVDVEDPALTIDNPLMNSQFLGEGQAGLTRLEGIRAKILLTTTPNIGTEGFPLKRPKNVAKLVHVWHSVCDTSFYHKGALDNYDVALTVSDWVEKNIRIVEKARKLKRKEVLTVGLPYFDELLKAVGREPRNSSEKVILIAPSWGEKNCLKLFGTDFLKGLTSAGFKIIIRPHPQSLKIEKEFFDSLKEKFSDSLVEFDFEIDGTRSLNQADLLISDKSSIRFDFAFLYKRPVVTLDIPPASLDAYEATYLPKLWEEETANKIGICLNLKEKDRIVEIVEKALQLNSTTIEKIGTESISFIGQSSIQIANWLEKVSKN